MLEELASIVVGKAGTKRVHPYADRKVATGGEEAC